MSRADHRGRSARIRRCAFSEPSLVPHVEEMHECGRIHHNLGGDEKFVCPNRNCGLVIHRDINGARNMLLMNLAVLREVLVSMRDAETRQVAAGILSGMRNDTRCAAWHWELMDNENP